MNKVILLGRLTTKPELRYTNSNVPFARFSVAVNRQFNNQDGTREADFINVVVWRRQAEIICNYFDKGNQIAIEGRLQTGSYDDKDGNKRYTTDVVLEQFHFVDPKGQKPSMENDISPYDYQSDSQVNDVNVENDPFADFGDSVSIDDNFLE